MLYLFLNGCFSCMGSENQSFEKIDAIVRNGLSQKAFPGCQVVVMKNGHLIFNKSYGVMSYDDPEKVNDSTLYDLASLTKIAGTLLAVMKLYDENRIDLDQSLSHYLPFFLGSDKDSITIRQLLLHESGLPPSLNLIQKLTTKLEQEALPIGAVRYKKDFVSAQNKVGFDIPLSDSLWLRNEVRDTAIMLIKHMKKGPAKYVYSCVNFILLKEVVEHITSMKLDVYLNDIFYVPMGLKTLSFNPLKRFKKDQIAPTLKWDYIRGITIQGWVQDPDAALLGGVSGNAGLFGSAKDVAFLCQMMLNEGSWKGTEYISKETIRLFTSTVSKNGRRGLGFDRAQPGLPLSKNPCGALAPASVYGHTGYTGTCCWIDPTNQLVYVFLSNRTYPSDKKNLLARLNIRTNIQNAIYQSMK